MSEPTMAGQNDDRSPDPQGAGGDPQMQERDYQGEADSGTRLSSDPDPDPDADVAPDAPPGLGEPAEHPDPPPGT